MSAYTVMYCCYFNPRSHERSDGQGHLTCNMECNFNPRSHERSDTVQTAFGFQYVEFQSTLPREERQQLFRPVLRRHLFQSTLPREERHAQFLSKFLYLLYFNPRSHERSDILLCGVSAWLAHISIHAPTRGATENVIVGLISTLFQSTLPREERPFQQVPVFLLDISIHAPTRGATHSR